MPRRLVLTLTLLCLALIAACEPAPTPERLVAHVALAPSPTSQPNVRAQPASPTQQSPTVTPLASSSPVPAPSETRAPGTGVPRVGVQVGHWNLKDLPEELAKIRGNSGAYYRGYDEWEVNFEIATRLQRRLEAAGVVVDLLPATIPVSYKADAFIAVHCDGVAGTLAAKRRGWKAATSFQASPAAEALLEAVEGVYGRVTGLPRDTRGASFDMRAYYAFASYRYQHAIAPTTPGIIVEAGFMTHPADRALLFDNPDLVAQGIAEGILAFLAARDAATTVPPALPTLQVSADVALFEQPNHSADVVRKLVAGEPLVTLSQTDGWYLVTTRQGWDIGWVRAEDVQT